MTKVCTVCKKEKSLDDFHNAKHANGRTYKKGACKQCFTQYSKPYIEKWKKDSNGTEVINKRRRERAKLPEIKEKHRLQSRKYLETRTDSVLLQRARKRAKDLNLPFNISKEDIIIPEKCPLLEIPLVIGTKDSYKSSPSLDRVVPELGYVKGNVQVISMLANTMKNSASKELLRTFAKNILRYIDNNDIV